MKNHLEKVALITEEISAKLDTPIEVEDISKDLKSQDWGFNIAALATEQDDLDLLNAFLETIYNADEIKLLPPYGRIKSWSKQHTDTILRSRICIISIKARKLMPGILAKIVELSNEHKIHVIYLVEDMGRVRIPQNIIQNAPGEIAKIHSPLLFEVYYLSDDRFNGISRDQLKQKLVGLDRSNRAELVAQRISALAKLRVEQLEEILRNQEKTALDESGELLKLKQLGRAGQAKVSVYLKMAVMQISEYLHSIINTLEEIDYSSDLKDINSDELEQDDIDDAVDLPDSEQEEAGSGDEEYAELIEKLRSRINEGMRAIKSLVKPSTESFSDDLTRIREKLYENAKTELDAQISDVSGTADISSNPLIEKMASDELMTCFSKIGNLFASALEHLDKTPDFDLQNEAMMKIWIKIRRNLDQNPVRSDDPAKEKPSSKSGTSEMKDEPVDIAQQTDIRSMIGAYGDQYVFERAIKEMLKETVENAVSDLNHLVSNLPEILNEDILYRYFTPIGDMLNTLIDHNSRIRRDLRKTFQEIADLDL